MAKGTTGLTKEQIHQRHLTALENKRSKVHGHASHAGLHSGGVKQKKNSVPEVDKSLLNPNIDPKQSRWPKESSGWNGRQKAAYSQMLSHRFPNEDSEYGMPDGSEN